jgi:TonB family protein
LLGRSPLNGGSFGGFTPIGVTLAFALVACQPGEAAPRPAPTKTPAVVAPVLLSRVEASLPKGRQPTPITLEATITEEGEVRDVRVVRSQSPDLDRYYIDALRQWKYQPGSIDGKPVAVTLSVVMTVSYHE